MEDEMIGFIDEAEIQKGFLAYLEDKMDEIDNPELITEVKSHDASISIDWLTQATNELREHRQAIRDMERYINPAKPEEKVQDRHDVTGQLTEQKLAETDQNQEQNQDMSGQQHRPIPNKVPQDTKPIPSQYPVSTQAQARKD